MIKSSNYSSGYNVVLKCAVSDGRIYICGTCCYCEIHGIKLKIKCKFTLKDCNVRL
jgi:hypothetical protein